MTLGPVVYIDRYYDDDWDEPKLWPRRLRLESDPEWTAHCEYGDRFEEAAFSDVDAALTWGRTRAAIVLVRLGANIEAIYSAGRTLATEHVDGSGWPVPPWPPSRWPDYDGPPEPDWPLYADHPE